MDNINSPVPALLVLESGHTFRGHYAGIEKVVFGEVVFNTAVTGYQEVLTDPSYHGQMIAFTTSHVGNTGINFQDNESHSIHAAALIVRDMPHHFSNWQGQTSLRTFLAKKNVPAIIGIDTRRLVNILTRQGNTYACIVPATTNIQEALTSIQNNKHFLLPNTLATNRILLPKNKIYRFSVVVYDFGVKESILSSLLNLGCRLILVPPNTSATDVMHLQADGILLSNGPGDPSDYQETIHQIKLLAESDTPILGICLGHQLLALANGAQISKMKQGHHGTNHPVQNVQTKKIYITSQNHNFVVNEATLRSDMHVTHRSAFDNTIQGLTYLNRRILSFQGHPEGGPGPIDISEELFRQFIHFLTNSRIMTSVSA